MFLEAVSVKNSKSQSDTEDLQGSNCNARASEQAELFLFSPRDLEFIVKFSEESGSDIFRQIVQSICPSIYGHELVKGRCYMFSLSSLVLSFSGTGFIYLPIISSIL